MDPSMYHQSAPDLSLPSAVHDVWAHNLFDEFRLMIEVAQNYPIIAIDTEFPGQLVEVPYPDGVLTAHYTFITVITNVNLLKLIQIGFSFFNTRGERPPAPNTWQFNFRFNQSLDMSSPDSLGLLIKHGFDFQKHNTEGIEHVSFAELMYSSNLLMNPRYIWVTFHGNSDLCYLIKVLINTHIHHVEQQFFSLLNQFFPRVYDIKVMSFSCQGLPNSLQSIADVLGVPREGQQHHAGSDSIITGRVFFTILSRFFENIIYDERFLGQIFGFPSNNACAALKAFPGESKKPSYFKVQDRNE